MIKLFGGRGLTAVRGLFALALAATVAVPASAQSATVAQAVRAPTVYMGNGQAVQALMSTPSAMIAQAPLAMASSLPLTAMVAMSSIGAPLDREANCMAVAVYHEARGETLEGQLAVARVIINRAASGKYPTTWCEVVKQPWQFSFVNPRTGRFPSVSMEPAAWVRAQAITRLAMANAVPLLDTDVLWYHADYVSPSWGSRLNRVEKIGTHIFYSA